LNLHSRGFFSFSRSGAGVAGVFSIDTAGLRLPCAAMRSRGGRGHRSTAQAARQPLWCAAAVWRRKGRPERGGVGNVCRPPGNQVLPQHALSRHAYPEASSTASVRGRVFQQSRRTAACTTSPRRSNLPDAWRHRVAAEQATVFKPHSGFPVLVY
jgi:hypothetical protein